MTTNDYKPRDRVINSISNGIGTITATEEDGSIRVDWDSGFKDARWSAASVNQFIKPAPVKVGDHMRVDAPGWTGETVCTGLVPSILDGSQCVTFTTPDGHNRQALLEFVRAIVAPTPAPVDKPEPFMIGDRVQYGTTDQHTKEYRGLLGTIQRIIGADGRVSGVKWDTKPNVVSHTTSYLHRQPIEPGCFVREKTGANVFGNNRPVEVFEVKDDKVRVQGFLGTFWTDAAKLVRVAAPVVAFDLASGPDASAVAFTRIVNDPAHLKQAQALALAIYVKHFAHADREFKVADNLPHVLDQIDNMTAGMVHNRIEVEAAEYLDKITEFAAWISANIKVPVGSDDVFDIAKRLLDDQKTAIVSMARGIRGEGFISPGAMQAWADQYDPKPFKRGDLVTWGAEAFTGRITTLHPIRDHHEVIILTCNGSNAKEYIGTFVRPAIDLIRHVKS